MVILGEVYMDSFTDQIVTPTEAEDRLFDDAQDFEWENTIASFSWAEIKDELKETDFWDTIVNRFRDIHFPLRFTEYKVYDYDPNEDQNEEPTTPEGSE